MTQPFFHARSTFHLCLRLGFINERQNLGTIALQVEILKVSEKKKNEVKGHKM